MRIADVKVGKAYLMKSGAIGRVVNQHSKSHVRVKVVFPFPHETVVPGRDIDREVSREEVPEQFHAALFDQEA